MSVFPARRQRRLRKTPQFRQWVAESTLSADQLVYPLFVRDTAPDKVAVASMPGVYQHTLNTLLSEVELAVGLGVKQFLLFGVPDEKDFEATSAWVEHGVVQRALRLLNRHFGDDVILIADTCLCEYTAHGHCGMVVEGRVLNDPTVELLGRVAASQAEAGADVIAPSDMMDGRVAWIRDVLDEAGYVDTPILSYAAKYASSFYGPFRDAAQSAPAFGDRRSYQMDPRNRREALEEVRLDLEEGADMIMVKPAMAYLDILRDIREFAPVPVVAYSVSGEYAMVKAAAAQGWLDERAVTLEMLTCLRRAGSDSIVTYAALDAARWLKS